MNTFFQESIENYKKLDRKSIKNVLEFGYDLHLNFVKIHAFVDWNWRTARLIMNIWLLYALNNIDIVYFTNRQEYIDSLENSAKDISQYYNFMHKNFLEFKDEEFELISNNIIYKY